MQERLKEVELSNQIFNVQQLTNEEAAQQFVWPKYKNDRERIKALTEKYSKQTCIQAFAQEYGLDLSNLSEEKIYQKDLRAGEMVTITGINGSYGNDVFFEVNGSSVVSIDMRKEKRFLDLLGLEAKQFIESVKSKEFKDSFVEKKFTALITESSPNVRASLSAGFAEKIKDEFNKQIKNPTNAYKARVIGKNGGGFIVDVMGVQAFLPGSLAAANKIIDFDAYINKEIIVMIEDYLSEIKTYVVSHKKYLEYALPNIISQYDWSKPHTGVVTGTSGNGVFVEFYEMITGLLHPLKMNDESRARFEARGYKPGDEITCYVHDIQNNRLVLTDFEPGSEEDKIQVGTKQKGKVTGNAKFGTFVQLKTGESGVIKKGEKQYQKGDIVFVEVTEILEDGKIYFKEVEKTQE